MTQRFIYTGTPALTADVKTGGVPTGELNVGECGTAQPMGAQSPWGFWVFTSDRGVTITCPKHDLKAC